jgi:N6-adenosine-specific RNA methylase IME4
MVSVDELPPAVRDRVMAQIRKAPATPEPGNEKLEIQLLQARALDLWKQDEDSAERLGKALLDVQDAMGWGSFQKWYEANGLDKNRVNYCIRKWKKLNGLLGREFTGVSVISPPMLRGVYRIIYADPPWEYPDYASDRYTSVHDKYATMTLDEICKMELPLTNKDAVLFMWTTAPYIFDSKKVLDAWEFEYKIHFVWPKQTRKGKQAGMVGGYSRVTHELLLVGTRGSCQPDTEKRLPSVQYEPRYNELFKNSLRAPRKHSEKPGHFRNLIDRLYPSGNRIELFARGSIPTHWDGWGNEFEPDAEQMKRELDARLGDPLFENLGLPVRERDIWKARRTQTR